MASDSIHGSVQTLFQEYGEKVGRVLFWGLIMAYAIVQFISLPDVPILEVDSGSYIKFLPSRTAGYPLFLRWVSVDRAPWVQVGLYTAALTWLGMETCQFTHSYLWAAGMVFLVMGNRELNHYHAEIMTESLFATVLILFLGLVVRFIGRPDWRPVVMASIVAGLAAAIRPSGYALLPVLVLMVLMVRELSPTSLWKLVAAAVIPMVLVVGVERGYTRYYQGGKATSLAGRHFFAKAGIIDGPSQAAAEADPKRKRLFVVLEEDFAPVRNLLREAPDAGIRIAMIPDYETCLEYACTEELRNSLRRDYNLTNAAIDSMFLKVGMERIANAPFEYLKLSWSHYRSMWSHFVLYNPAYFQSYREFIARHRPLPFEAGVPDLIPNPNPRKITYFRPPRTRLVIIGAWVAGMALAGLAFAWRGRVPSPAAGSAGLVGLTVHGLLVFTALVGVGIPRYVTVLWPAMMVAVVLACRWAFEAWMAQRLKN
jgi:hypothetical protein